MKRGARLATGAVGLAVLVGGCTAASHLKVLQPPPVPKSPAMRLPQSPFRHRVQAQLGIAMDFYAYPGENVKELARQDVAYVQSLDANALSISFPFFVQSASSSTVYVSHATPTSQQLGEVVSIARQAGLYVSLRPLMDESVLPLSRNQWTPPSLSEFFTSYQKFLLPYARMAQRRGVEQFFVGTELSSFSYVSQWVSLDKAIRTVYKGHLAYSRNWGRLTPLPDGSVREDVDAYPPMNTSSLAGLTRDWVNFDHFVDHNVESEVGIDAVSGAYSRPYVHQWSASTLNPRVQYKWFTAACAAAQKTHLRGIYFWPLNLGEPLNQGPTLKQQGQWVGSDGASAIKKCFNNWGNK